MAMSRTNDPQPLVIAPHHRPHDAIVPKWPDAHSVDDVISRPPSAQDTHRSDVFRVMGSEIGNLVADKNRQYGDSAAKTGRLLEILYPDGIPVFAMDDALLIVRCLDKFSRIAQRGSDGADLGGESPWRDVSGYGLLGLEKDSKKNAK